MEVDSSTTGSSSRLWQNEVHEWEVHRSNAARMKEKTTGLASSRGVEERLRSLKGVGGGEDIEGGGKVGADRRDERGLSERGRSEHDQAEENGEREKTWRRSTW